MVLDHAEDQSWLKGPAQYPGLKQPGGGQPQYIATYTEELLMGYRWFDSANEAPAFAFGAGLSYTKFSVVCPAAGISSAGVSCTVTNTGDRAGSTVLQLYLSYPASVGEPPQQLRDFTKVKQLKAGASAKVQLKLSERDRSVWDTAAEAWAPVAGTFGVTIAQSSRDPAAAKGSFTV